MPDRVIIEGDLVRTEHYEYGSEVRLEDLLPQIEHRPPVFMGIIPKTTHFLYWDESNPQDKRALILSELAPGVRRCRYDRRAYTLSIPWTYFLYQFRTGNDPLRPGAWAASDNRVFWAREQITSLDSQIGRALVPNCNAQGSICYGNTGVPVNLPLAARVDRLTHEFYATTFMHDSGAGSPWGSETGSTSWARWHEESRNDPVAWQRFPEWGLPDGRRGTAAIPLRTVRELLTEAITAERPTTIEVNDHIPDMVMPATFGMAEQWARGLDPTQRHRLRRALDIIAGEDPNAEAEPAPVPVEDPGGEPIEDEA